MSKKWKAAMYGIAFVAGCEIGIAIQLMKMIHKFNVKESALNETIPVEPEEELDSGFEKCEEEDFVTDDYVTEDISGEFPDGEVSPA